MSTATDIYDSVVDKSVADGTISKDEAKAKKLSWWVRFLLWIAGSAPIITAVTAICYSMKYFIGVDPLDLIENGTIKLIMNIIIIFSAMVTILLSFFMNIVIYVFANIAAAA